MLAWFPHPPKKKKLILKLSLRAITPTTQQQMFVMSTSPSIVLRQRYTRVCTHCVPFFYCHCIYYIVNLTLSINILIYLHGSIVSRIDHGFISLSCRTKQKLHRKIIRISVTSLKHLEIPWRHCKHCRMRMITAVTTYIKGQLKK